MNSSDSPISSQTNEEESSNNDSGYEFMPNLSSTNNRLNKILITAEEMFKMEGGQEMEAGIGQLKLLIEKINFLKANNKDYDRKIQLVCYYNISCGYQTLVFTKVNNAIDSCLHHIEKSIQILKQLLPKEPKHWFKLTLLLIKTQLQYCALLSQIENHEKALEVGIQTNDLLIMFFEKGLVQCLSILNKSSSISDEIVSFTQNVLIKAKEYLVQLVKIENYEKIMNNSHEEFKNIKEKNYFWKDNYENNEKTFRKELQKSNNEVNINRNILGLKINNSWIQEFTIGKVMHMKPINYLELVQQDNIVFQFSYRNIIQKIIYISVTYFSIATEMRFIENEKQKQKQVHQKDLKKSEIFHLKAIEIVCKYIKQSSIFVNHLINSYQRHYYHDLIPIDEEPSYAEYSMMSSRPSRRDKNSIHSNHSQQEPYENICDFNAMNRCQSERKVTEKNPLFLFKKSKKSTLPLDQHEDERYIPIDKSLAPGDSSKSKTKTFHKQRQQQKLQKSTSTSNFHSYRSALKKSFSIKGTKSITTRISKSPEPSINLTSKVTKTKTKKTSRR